MVTICIVRMAAMLVLVMTHGLRQHKLISFQPTFDTKLQ
jgi:hypothetical protein